MSSKLAAFQKCQSLHDFPLWNSMLFQQISPFHSMLQDYCISLLVTSGYFTCAYYIRKKIEARQFQYPVHHGVPESSTFDERRRVTFEMQIISESL